MADNISAAQAGTVRLGDLTVNRLGLGTNRLHDDAASQALLERATELGINFIDTAHSYSNGQSEVVIGKALAAPNNGIVIATKGGAGQGASAAQLRAELQQSLRSLQTDCIDLYQLHRVDPDIPLSETMAVLKQFQNEGLIRHIGLSEVTVEQLEQALTVAPVVSVQNEYNVANRKYETVVDYCSEHGIVFIPWFPLGGSADDSEKVGALVADIAKKYQATVQQLALAWLLKRSPLMLPIPGTTAPEHLADNLWASALQLSDEDYAALKNGG